MDKIEGINRPPLLMEIAAEKLMKLIVEGRIPPETRINEVELSKKLKISRTPLREALFKLENSGFVTRIKNGGWAIASIDMVNMVEKYEMKIVIEVNAVLRSTDASRIINMVKFNKIMDQMNNCAETKDYEKYRELDYQFHRCFLSLHNNKYMENVYNQAGNHMEWIRSIAISPLLDINESISDHKKIINHLEKNDILEAAKTLFTHHGRLINKIVESMQA